jgi:hypothetical protein
VEAYLRCIIEKSEGIPAQTNSGRALILQKLCFGKLKRTFSSLFIFNRRNVAGISFYVNHKLRGMDRFLK